MVEQDAPLGYIANEEEFKHYGIARKSGRYPWGSGENPHQRSMSFRGMVDDLRAKGFTDADIAKSFSDEKNKIRFTTTDLRSVMTISKNEIRAADEVEALKLRDKGMATSAIARKMGKNESTVRSLLDPAMQERRMILNTTADMLRKEIEEKQYLDFGKGTENHIGITRDQLATAVAMLKDEGYQVHYVKSETLGTGKETRLKILTKEDVPYSEVYANRDKIRTIVSYSEDRGRSYRGALPPVPVDPKRVAVRYAEQGGAEKDGVIELRRGVDDISLGEARYAQVRVKVGDGHYLKGMAMYSDDMPAGVDMVFNTNKSTTGDKLDAMKPIKKDIDDPFGTTVRQRHYIDKKGNEKLSPLNIVGTEDPEGNKTPGEEGGWSTWSKRLSSQMLSKQPHALADQQLKLTADIKRAELEEIRALTNSTVRKKLLESFADDADSAATHLKAAGLPRTANHVILPINSLKDTEVYAPNYQNGETVVLVRHPHGGTFEIPQLTVNNRNREANRLIKGAVDAIGINHKVAEQLSGADFDGDTVLVIPNNNTGKGKIKASKPLEALKNFDPRTTYKEYPGMKIMANTQTEMGVISNLITDMTIKGANEHELARAVKHSMVVIDAEKHKLNYRQSAIDNDIKGLRTKYQGSARSGASTIISRASSDVRPLARKPRIAAEGGPIDKETGEKRWTYTGETYPKVKVNKRTGEIITEEVARTTSSKAMLEVSDAYSLVSSPSGTPIESVYADHANRLKAMANQARKEAIFIKTTPASPTAKATYIQEVAQLDAALNIAKKNAPLDRQAQVLAKAHINAKVREAPAMDKDDLKKLKASAIAEARLRTGAKKQNIPITPRQWEAIQAGAISDNKLKEILNNTDLDVIKKLATPRDVKGLSPAKLSQAKLMLSRGYTQAEVAAQLGISTSTLNAAVKA